MIQPFLEFEQPIVELEAKINELNSKKKEYLDAINYLNDRKNLLENHPDADVRESADVKDILTAIIEEITTLKNDYSKIDEEIKTLTTLDPALTTKNFSEFSGMTVVSSGGGGAGNNLQPGQPGGLGGTGGGNAHNRPLSSPTSFGSGGGGFGTSAGTGSNGYAGVMIVRYLA